MVLLLAPNQTIARIVNFREFPAEFFKSRTCVAELRSAKKLEIQIRCIRPTNVQILASSPAGIIIKSAFATAPAVMRQAREPLTAKF
jgi:hypothetical protein